MKSINLLGLAMISLIRAKESDKYYTNDNMSVEFSQHTKDVASREDSKNPVFLDAYKNDLYPSNIVTVLRSPRFIGNPPPGITKFMASQIFLSGESGSKKGEKKYTYPLFSSNAMSKFDDKSRNIKIEDICSRGGKGCPEGYKKVTVKNDTVDSKKRNNAEEVDLNTPRTASPEEGEAQGSS